MATIAHRVADYRAARQAIYDELDRYADDAYQGDPAGDQDRRIRFQACAVALADAVTDEYDALATFRAEQEAGRIREITIAE